MIDKFLEVCDSFITFTLGEKRDGKDRRVKRQGRKILRVFKGESNDIETLNYLGYGEVMEISLWIQ